jgi:hypothetical protein
LGAAGSAPYVPESLRVGRSRSQLAPAGDALRGVHRAHQPDRAHCRDQAQDETRASTSACRKKCFSSTTRSCRADVASGSRCRRSLGLATCFACRATTEPTAAYALTTPLQLALLRGQHGPTDGSPPDAARSKRRVEPRAGRGQDLLFSCDADLAHACGSPPSRAETETARAPASATGWAAAEPASARKPTEESHQCAPSETDAPQLHPPHLV